MGKAGQNFVVEVAGSGAAGKSTLLAELSQRSRLRGLKLDVASSEPSPMDFLRFCFDRSGWAAWTLARTLVFSQKKPVFKVLKGRQSWVRSYFLIGRLRSLVKNHAAVLRSGGGIVIIEHGPFGYDADQYFYFGSQARRTPAVRASALIFLEVDEDELVRRLHERGLKKGPESHLMATDRDFRQEKNSCWHRMRQQALCQVPAITIDGSLTKELVADKAFDFILCEWEKWKSESP